MLRPSYRSAEWGIAYVLFVEGHDQLGQDLVVDHAFGQLLVHVGEAAEGERGALGDGGDIVEEERPQEAHHAGRLEGLDVLGTRGQLGHRLHEGHPRLLVLLEGLQDCLAHVVSYKNMDRTINQLV